MLNCGIINLIDMTPEENEFERMQIQNYKLRRKLKEYIKFDGQLIHVTLAPSMWRKFCDYLEVMKTKKNEENKTAVE
jgi:hypothetical protein